MTRCLLTGLFQSSIAFALLGPIVPPALIPYRSEIMMPTLPRMVPGDTTNGRAEKRKGKSLFPSLSRRTAVVVC